MTKKYRQRFDLNQDWKVPFHSVRRHLNLYFHNRYVNMDSPSKLVMNTSNHLHSSKEEEMRNSHRVASLRMHLTD